MKRLTVFTPTYNRAKLLQRCYEGMKRQTNQDFIWMIIDDGSKDYTEKLVNSWIKENNGFSIEYYYKENGGLYTAYNEAILNIETPLCVCIDSDDFMPDDAVEKILKLWELKGSDEYAGIVGLDFDINGKLIGEYFPEQKSINLIDLFIGKYPVKKCDRTYVVRTDLYKQYYPLEGAPGEKDFSSNYVHYLISKKYDFLVMNENLRFVEYQPGGMSDTIFQQYKNSPNNLIKERILYLSFEEAPFTFKFKHSIHLVSSCVIAKKFRYVLRYSPCKRITFGAIPFGIILAMITVVLRE